MNLFKLELFFMLFMHQLGAYINIVEGISKSRELRLGILAMFYLEGFFNDWLRPLRLFSKCFET